MPAAPHGPLAERLGLRHSWLSGTHSTTQVYAERSNSGCVVVAPEGTQPTFRPGATTSAAFRARRLQSPAERALFRRLSVFACRWTLESAEAVCDGGDIQLSQVVQLPLRLVNKLLVLYHDGRTGTLTVICWKPSVTTPVRD
jgi:hypothetical protein